MKNYVFTIVHISQLVILKQLHENLEESASHPLSLTEGVSQVMGSGKEDRQLGANLFMANGSFIRQLLRIVSSDLDALLERHSLGT